MVQWCTLRMQELWQADASAEEGGSDPGPERKSKKPAYARVVAGGCVRRGGRISPRARGKSKKNESVRRQAVITETARLPNRNLTSSQSFEAEPGNLQILKIVLDKGNHGV